MKPAAFAYAAPTLVAEVLDLLARYGADARVLAGGQTLGPMLNMRMVTPSVLIDINRLTDLQSIVLAGSGAMMGAQVRQRDALESDIVGRTVPLLRDVLPYVGHYQTRNRGTVCGSIAHADPTAELPLALLTLKGTVHLASAKRRRQVAAADFFLGVLTTARQQDEFIVAVEWPNATPRARFAFEEVSVAHVAVVACAAGAEINDAGIVTKLDIGLTGISDRPLAIDTWPYLNAKPGPAWHKDIAACVRSTLPYVDDLHASAAYRRHVAGFLVERCLAEVVAMAPGEERVVR
ncbi:MAG: FAD binding domain-containing protein [Pseudomonadota bacterium]